MAPPTRAARSALETANASERESEKNPKSERVADAARAARRAAQDASALSAAMAWTPAARRLFSLVESCLSHKEPALLVGETGCGKTSVCQLLALLRGQRLRV